MKINQAKNGVHYTLSLENIENKKTILIKDKSERINPKGLIKN